MKRSALSSVVVAAVVVVGGGVGVNVVGVNAVVVGVVVAVVVAVGGPRSGVGGPRSGVPHGGHTADQAQASVLVQALACAPLAAARALQAPR